MKILPAIAADAVELYKLQLLAFESEAEMIGSRCVPALMETEEEHIQDFPNWHTLKLVNDTGNIIGAIRYRKTDDIIEVGRLMVHPAYRHQGLAQQMLTEVDNAYPHETKELYTCTKIPVPKAGLISAYTQKLAIPLSKNTRKKVAFLLYT